MVSERWPCDTSIWCYLVTIRNVPWETVIGIVIRVKLKL